jgi:hypothetical protein
MALAFTSARNRSIASVTIESGRRAVSTSFFPTLSNPICATTDPHSQRQTVSATLPKNPG